MATIGETALTLSDWQKRTGADGAPQTIIEMLSQTNEVLDDMLVKPSNEPASHLTTVRSGLPEPTWRRLNYGVQPSKSATAQVRDTMGMCEDYLEVDMALADLNGNTADFRLSESRPKIEGMNQAISEALFYSNSVIEQQKFMGLSPRYNSLSAENGVNIIDAGGSGSKLTSIWLIVWGDNTCHGIFPKNQIAGIQYQDLGQQTLLDDKGGKYEGYRSHLKWNIGLTLRDWRYVVRIANIDIDTLTKTGSTGADLIDLLTDAVEQPPNLTIGRPVLYMHKKIRTYLRKQIRNKSNVNLTQENVAGKKVLFFDEVPIKRCDGLLLTEERVV